MRPLAIAVLASTSALFIAAPLWADSFDLQIRSRTIAADLVLDVANLPSDSVAGNNGYRITSVTGSVQDITFGSQTLNLTSSDSALVAVDPGSNASSPTYADGFAFDNLLYPHARINSIFDWPGLLLSFWGSDGYTQDSPYLLKLFTDSSTSNQGFMYWSDNASTHERPMPLIAADPTLTPIATPEPGSFVLFGTGLLVVLMTLLLDLRRTRTSDLS